MRIRLFIIVLTVFLVVFCETSTAIDDAVGRGTAPASSGTSGLIRSPNPIDTSSNLVVTGNVGGGKHFRGVVPYRAPTDFGAATGSSLFDPFLRRSVGSGDYIRYTGRPAEYFSQTRTVSSTIPGGESVFRQPTLVTAGGQERDFLYTISKEKILSPVEVEQLNSRFRPLSMTTQQLEKVFSSDVEKYLQERSLKAEEIIEQEEQLQESLKGLSKKAEELKQDIIAEKYLSKKIEPNFEKKIARPFKPTDSMEQLAKAEQRDIYDIMQQQIDNLKRELEQLKVEDSTEEVTEEEPADEKESALDEFSKEELTIRAQVILGEHKTFASFAKDKFNNFMMVGEEYLKEGKYYWAADAYTMASVYKPGDPLANAGKSHALFAAGEYMSSALFLSRALEIFPEYAQFKIDVISMLGSKDLVEARIADVKEWLGNRDVAELHFLLAYYYHHMGRSGPAKQEINAAYQEMSDSVAVASLKKVIENSK